MAGPIEKVAAIVLRDGLLLVVRKRGTSVFISPGGKPEPGETVEQTLARELREETGLVLRTHRPWGTYTAGSALEPSAVVHIQVQLADADGTPRAAEEIEEVAWIDGGYRSDGIELGSVFADHVVPELLAHGLIRQRRPS
jgi:8-oxo-dGTP pyrophosphatase MutT (NUDIX family)